MRLLQIQPRSENAELCATASEISPENRLSYLMLSHCWGDSAEATAVQRHGLPSRISENLHAASCQFRVHEADAFFWVYTTCINQAERVVMATQLSTMRDFYARAQGDLGVADVLRQGKMDVQLLSSYRRAAYAEIRLLRGREASKPRLQNPSYRSGVELYHGFQINPERCRGQIEEDRTSSTSDRPTTTGVRRSYKLEISSRYAQAVPYASIEDYDHHSTNSRGTVYAHPLLGTQKGVEGFELRCEAKCDSFFAFGRVFATLSHTDHEVNHGSRWMVDSLKHNKFGKRIISHIQGMAVVKEGLCYCWCIPINTYNGCGTSRYAIQTPGRAAKEYTAGNYFDDHHQVIDVGPATRTTNNGSNIAHKPQQPPLRMSPDDDDDDESYGFHRASGPNISRHPEINKGRSGVHERDSKKHVERQRPWSRPRSKIDQYVLSEWRSVIIKICGSGSEARKQDWCGLCEEVFGSGLASKEFMAGYCLL